MSSIPNAIQSQRLLIVDFGSQYTQLIARRVREAGVYCEILPFDVGGDVIREFAPRGIILSGGPESVTEGMSPRIDDAVFALGVPLLGICYGMHALATQLGGEVVNSSAREFGHADVTTVVASKLLGAPSERSVWMSHGDKVTRLPDGFQLLAKTANAPIAAMMDEARNIYAVQFHPEVTHSEGGRELYQQFARSICGCEALWTAENIADQAVLSMREQVGDSRVLLGLSGGVDSSVGCGTARPCYWRSTHVRVC